MTAVKGREDQQRPHASNTQPPRPNMEQGGPGREEAESIGSGQSNQQLKPSRQKVPAEKLF